MVSVVVLVGFLELLFVGVLGKILVCMEIRAVYDPVARSPKSAPLPSFIWPRPPHTILIALMIVCVVVFKHTLASGKEITERAIPTQYRCLLCGNVFYPWDIMVTHMAELAFSAPVTVSSPLMFA